MISHGFIISIFYNIYDLSSDKTLYYIMVVSAYNIYMSIYIGFLKARSTTSEPTTSIYY